MASRISDLCSEGVAEATVFHTDAALSGTVSSFALGGVVDTGAVNAFPDKVSRDDCITQGEAKQDKWDQHVCSVFRL